MAQCCQMQKLPEMLVAVYGSVSETCYGLRRLASVSNYCCLTTRGLVALCPCDCDNVGDSPPQRPINSNTVEYLLVLWSAHTPSTFDHSAIPQHYNWFQLYRPMLWPYGSELNSIAAAGDYSRQRTLSAGVDRSRHVAF